MIRTLFANVRLGAPFKLWGVNRLYEKTSETQYYNGFDYHNVSYPLTVQVASEDMICVPYENLAPWDKFSPTEKGGDECTKLTDGTYIDPNKNPQQIPSPKSGVWIKEFPMIASPRIKKSFGDMAINEPFFFEEMGGDEWFKINATMARKRNESLYHYGIIPDRIFWVSQSPQYGFKPVMFDDLAVGQEFAIVVTSDKPPLCKKVGPKTWEGIHDPHLTQDTTNWRVYTKEDVRPMVLVSSLAQDDEFELWGHRYKKGGTNPLLVAQGQKVTMVWARSLGASSENVYIREDTPVDIEFDGKIAFSRLKPGDEFKMDNRPCKKIERHVSGANFLYLDKFQVHELTSSTRVARA